MPKRDRAPKLPRSEWDFTQIDDLALADATTYEYARSSDRLRSALCHWLEVSIDGRKVREYIHARLLLVHNGVESSWISKSQLASRAISRRIECACSPEVSEQWEIFHLIQEKRPDFPAPWTSFQMRYAPNPNYSTVIIKPLWVTIGATFEALSAGDTLDEIEDRYRRVGGHSLKINWGDSPNVEKIIADFAEWVRGEARHHPRPRGKSAQSPVDPLKWLAAYRLSRAGYTFEAAQEFLRPHNDGGRLVPIYSDKSGWSDAIRRAKARIQRLDLSPAQKLASNTP
jgi:hypothetical protein